MPTALAVRPISADEHLAFVERASGSFLQTPAWGVLKSDWNCESLGWFRDEDLVGAALVLYRATPVVKRFLAYLPEGPVIDWSAWDVADVLPPLLAHLKR